MVLALRKVEEQGDWKLAGHNHFGDFLRAEFPNAIGVHRYTNVIQAVELYGEDLVRKVGPDAAHAMCRPEVAGNDTRRAELASAVKEHVATQGHAPQVSWVRSQIHRIAPETNRAPRLTGMAAELADVKRERDELKRENTKLTRENARLTKELARLSKRAA